LLSEIIEGSVTAFSQSQCECVIRDLHLTLSAITANRSVQISKQADHPPIVLNKSMVDVQYYYCSIATNRN